MHCLRNDVVLLEVDSIFFKQGFAQKFLEPELALVILEIKERIVTIHSLYYVTSERSCANNRH